MLRSHSESCGTFARLQVVIVDDDDVDSERLRRMILRMNERARVREARTSGDAFSIISSEHCDVILLDRRLGTESGTELLVLLKSLERAPPVVIVSGCGDERFVVEAMQLGASDYIPKSRLNDDLLRSVVANSIQRAALERELREQAARLRFLSLHDDLTGLPNRSLLFESLEQTLARARREHETFAVLQMDLDNFKAVNDHFGHAAGDALLRVIGSRLRHAVRSSDMVARIGGDEFVVILSGDVDADIAVATARKLNRIVDEPVVFQEHVLQVGVSIGVALWPDHADDVGALLNRADQAMYRAKGGRGTRLYQRRSDELPEGVEGPWIYPGRLLEAIRKAELFLEYQPIVAAADFKLRGVEALVRWQFTEGLVIPPSGFITMAERSEVIVDLSHWVLENALAQALEWREQGQIIPVSVNLSARMLEDDNLPAAVFESLGRYATSPELLTLEITETSLISNISDATRVLAPLTAAGVAVAIDDFGAGFTSFKELRDLDIDEIKIDAAFIAALPECRRSATIVQSIALLADGFGIPTTAEGVEDLAIVGDLLRLGCGQLQGYGIAHPMRGNALLEWISDWQGRIASKT